MPKWTQIKLITWHVLSLGLRGLKHCTHFNSVLCNKHQHRRRGNHFLYNCPKISFLAVIIPLASQSKHSHWQCWRLFNLARWTFITIDFLQPCPFLYTLNIWIHQILLRLLDDYRWYLYITEVPDGVAGATFEYRSCLYLCCRLTAAWDVKFSSACDYYYVIRVWLQTASCTLNLGPYFGWMVEENHSWD